MLDFLLLLLAWLGTILGLIIVIAILAVVITVVVVEVRDLWLIFKGSKDEDLDDDYYSDDVWKQR